MIWPEQTVSNQPKEDKLFICSTAHTMSLLAPLLGPSFALSATVSIVPPLYICPLPLPLKNCLPPYSSISLLRFVGVRAQGFIGQASKAATGTQEALKGLNQKEQAAILQAINAMRL